MAFRSVQGPYYRTSAPLTNDLIAAASASVEGIPKAPFASSGYGAYSISDLNGIIVDSRYSDAHDETGETLIPPSLSDFASTFAEDLQSVLDIELDVSIADAAALDSVFLTVNESVEYLDASGARTAEGYTLTISPSGIVISGASPLGVWWGTRTLLQQAILSEGSIPLGRAKDAPGWGIRGMMLDVARHYYPPEFLVELCSYMSFFKQNTFHLHLSDNLYNNVNIYSRERSLELYARFRLWSDSEDVAGLNNHKNESYTREQFEELQSACAARGVTIIPEIEAPGHALAIVQWKPELGLSDDLSLLNIPHPDTIPTMKTIWSTFLDWFHSKTVHIGADEYTADVDDYNRFVNAMAAHIRSASGKATRIWGTFPPRPEYGDENINSADVSVQHWAFFEDNPYHDYIRNGYAVLNSDDTFYTVNKWSGSYPQKVPIARTWNGDPATGGGIWHPHVFDTKDPANNPERSEPLVLGAVTPLWNDYGANASTYSEAYYVWREGIPALADKQWGGDLSEPAFFAALERLHPLIPGQNLERAVESTGPVIFNYTGITGVADQSGNGYDATTSCPLTTESTWAIGPGCSFATPLLSKGRNYTLSLRLLVEDVFGDSATIIRGADSALMLTPNVTLFAAGAHFRLNATVPAGTWVDLRVVGRGDRTFASARTTSLDAVPPGTGDSADAGEKAEEEFLVRLGVNGEFFVWTPVAIEAPIAELGGEGAGWTGQLAFLSLTSEV
ncbi:hypothetical protein DL766_006345 [Monosporascus sp. MC13-8B]|nr:hypothetical protein DL763_003830 [Monosporascus cannonballus]RYP27508.1 hypothetical protein DL766_006345 [Monosporascus sp. MC13-8B]